MARLDRERSRAVAIIAVALTLVLAGCATVGTREISAWGFTAEYGRERYRIIGLSPDPTYCDGARRTAIATWPIENVSACAPVTIESGTDYWLPATSTTLQLPALGFADEARCAAWSPRLGDPAIGCRPVGVKVMTGVR